MKRNGKDGIRMQKKKKKKEKPGFLMTIFIYQNILFFNVANILRLEPEAWWHR